MKTIAYYPAKTRLLRPLRRIAALTLLVLCVLCLPMRAADSLTDPLSRAVYSDGEVTLPYRLYVPADYDPDTAYPLLIFLHGSGGRGDDNEAQLPGGAVWWYLKQGLYSDFPCILLAPQCPEGRKWVMTDWEKGAYSTDEVPESPEMRAVLAIAAELEATYRIDVTRRYITGLSMGGFGTWDMVTRHPDLFAAAVPICGGGDPAQGARLAASVTAIWTFHCTGDRVVPCSGTTQTVEAIRNAGGEIECTLYTSNAHDAWTQTYSNPDVFKWLFAQKNPTAQPLTEGEPSTNGNPANGTPANGVPSGSGNPPVGEAPSANGTPPGNGNPPVEVAPSANGNPPGDGNPTGTVAPPANEAPPADTEPLPTEPAITAPGKTVGGTTAAAVARPPEVIEAPPADAPESTDDPIPDETDVRDPVTDVLREDDGTKASPSAPPSEGIRANTRRIAGGVELGFTLLAVLLLLALFLIRLCSRRR